MADYMRSTLYLFTVCPKMMNYQWVTVHLNPIDAKSSNVLGYCLVQRQFYVHSKVTQIVNWLYWRSNCNFVICFRSFPRWITCATFCWLLCNDQLQFGNSCLRCNWLMYEEGKCRWIYHQQVSPGIGMHATIFELSLIIHYLN